MFSITSLMYVLCLTSKFRFGERFSNFFKLYLLCSFCYSLHFFHPRSLSSHLRSDDAVRGGIHSALFFQGGFCAVTVFAGWASQAHAFFGQRLILARGACSHLRTAHRASVSGVALLTGWTTLGRSLRAIRAKLAESCRFSQSCSRTEAARRARNTFRCVEGVRAVEKIAHGTRLRSTPAYKTKR